MSDEIQTEKIDGDEKLLPPNPTQELKQEGKPWADAKQIFPDPKVAGTGNPEEIKIPDCAVRTEDIKKPLPEHAAFRPGEIIPLRGFNWRVLGYSRDMKGMLLVAAGKTGKRLKQEKGRRK